MVFCFVKDLTASETSEAVYYSAVIVLYHKPSAKEQEFCRQKQSVQHFF